MPAAYVSALHSFRKQIKDEMSQPQPEAPKTRGGIVPSSSRLAAAEQTKAAADVRYEPAQFVKRGIARFGEARKQIKFEKTQRQNKYAEAFSTGADEVAATKAPEQKHTAEGFNLVNRPYTNIPDGPKGQESYAAPSSGSGDLFSLLDKHEGASNYDTLFGHSQKDRFSGVKISEMTLGQLAEFSDPNGKYGQWVKSQVGRVATPMGRGQIVGSTLRAAAKEMGLSDDTVFSPAVQDQIIMHLATKRLRGQKTMAGKRAALRAEWEGFKHVSDADLTVAIERMEGKNNDYVARGDRTKDDEVA